MGGASCLWLHSTASPYQDAFFETKSVLKSHMNFQLGKVGISVWSACSHCYAPVTSGHGPTLGAHCFNRRWASVWTGWVSHGPRRTTTVLVLARGMIMQPVEPF